MIQIVTEYIVTEGEHGLFELAYGPGGAWSKLLTGCPGFRGVTLLQDEGNQRRYLAIEAWDSLAIRQEQLPELEEAYSELEDTLAEWTESCSNLGTFRIRAEAAVRPRPKKGRRYPR